MSESQPRKQEEGASHMTPFILAQLAESHGKIPNPEVLPERCRAIVFNPDGTKVLGIGRKRPGRDPYVVYPGGGLEDSDASAKDGVWRELKEELGLTPEQVHLTNRVIELKGEYFYLGYAPFEIEILAIGGPEAERDEAYGQYLPGWFPISDLVELNAFPEEITQIIVEANE